MATKWPALAPSQFEGLPYVDEAGDVMSGPLTVPALYVQGGGSAGSSGYTGTIIATAGQLQNLSITGTLSLGAGGSITGTYLTINSSGEITASNADLTGDITATSGELQDLSVTGTLTLSGSGELVTAESGQRVTITAAAGDRISFYSGSGSESNPAYIQAGYTGTNPYAYWVSPGVSGGDRATIRLYSNPSKVEIRNAASSNLLSVSNTGISLGGVTSVTGTFSASGATTLSSTLGVTGATTLTGILVCGSTTRPASDGGSNLGTNTIAWNKLYVKTIYINNKRVYAEGDGGSPEKFFLYTNQAI
jgi:fibronectin-binding autotransporter adhesin